MKFRVLDVQWHIGHQYEMLKFPFVQWSWLMQYKRRSFSSSIRGDLTHMFEYVPHYESGAFDAAILHLDQDCLDPVSWEVGKGSVYRDMDEVISDIPKIVVMHGTPYRPEYPLPYSDPQWMVDRLKQVLGKNKFIVNSLQASRQWQCGMPIIHGLDSIEWFDLPKYPRVVTTLSPSGMPSYYDRAFLSEVKIELKRRDIVHCQIGVDFVPGSWDEYREMIGRSLIYFNPTKESPMPRARTEAMLSGACILTTPYHDADTFIHDGINGFLIERDPEYVADLIEHLICEPDRAIAIGQRGKHTAQQIFGWERFASTWEGLLKEVTSTYKPDTA
jgi:hypothetical protein